MQDVVRITNNGTAKAAGMLNGLAINEVAVVPWGLCTIHFSTAGAINGVTITDGATVVSFGIGATGDTNVARIQLGNLTHHGDFSEAISS